MAGSTLGVQNNRLRRWALFGIAAVIISACSTSIEDSPAVQAATAAAASNADIEEPAAVTESPVDSNAEAEPSTADAIEPVEPVAEAGEASAPEDPQQAQTAPAEQPVPPALVDTQIVAAVSESGRAPAFGGGNPRTSVADALQVSLRSVGGPEIDVSQYLGQDVVLWFWAPWCAWCNAEAPRVDALSTEFAGEVEIVGVAGVSDEASMQDFVDRHDLGHITHLADLDGHFWFNLDVTYQPWWMFINDDGEVILNWQGRLSEEEIRAVMDQLVNA